MSLCEKVFKRFASKYVLRCLSFLIGIGLWGSISGLFMAKSRSLHRIKRSQRSILACKYVRNKLLWDPPSFNISNTNLHVSAGPDKPAWHFHPEKKPPVRAGCFSAKPRVTAGNSSALSPNLAFISGPSVKEPFLSGERKKRMRWEEYENPSKVDLHLIKTKHLIWIYPSGS